MSTPVWFVNFLKTVYPTRRSLAKLTKVPLIGNLVDHWLFRGDEMYVLPKDQTIQINGWLNFQGALASRIKMAVGCQGSQNAGVFQGF